jgi:hypothetical protein
VSHCDQGHVAVAAIGDRVRDSLGEPQTNHPKRRAQPDSPEAWRDVGDAEVTTIEQYQRTAVRCPAPEKQLGPELRRQARSGHRRNSERTGPRAELPEPKEFGDVRAVEAIAPFWLSLEGATGLELADRYFGELVQLGHRAVRPIGQGHHAGLHVRQLNIPDMSVMVVTG